MTDLEKKDLENENIEQNTEMKNIDSKSVNEKESLESTQNNSTENQSNSPKEVIEKGGIKLTLNKQTSDEINSIYDTIIQYDEFKDWSSNQKIDGFRPGHAPLTEENQRNFINAAISKIMSEIDLSNSFAVNYIQEVFKENEPIILTITVEKMPTMPEVDFSQYKIKSFKANVTKADIQKARINYADINSKPSPLILDKKAENSNFVKLEITNLQNANKETQEIKLGGFMINPELEEKLIGQKAGFKTIYSVNDKVSFEIKILEVKDSVFMSDEDIAKQLNIDIKDLDDKFKVELESNAEALSKNIINESIFKIIVELPFLLPTSILNHEYKETYSQTLFSLKYNENIDLETFIKGRLNITLDEFEQRMKNGAIFNAKLKFFLNHYAYKNNITTSKEELEKAIENRSQYFKEGLKEAEKYFANNEQERSKLIESVLHPKALEHIKSIIIIEDPKIISLIELESININELQYINVNQDNSQIKN